MSITAIYVNNVNLKSFGFITERVDGWADGLSVSDRVTTLPTRAGAIILAPDAETKPRTITVTGVIRRSSVSAVRQAVDAMKDLFYRGTTEVRFVDRLDRVVYARTQEFTVPAQAIQFDAPFLRLSFQWFVPDPLIYAYQGALVGIGATAVPIALGTAVIAPTIRIMGAATNPVLTYRRADGTVQQTQGFTITLAGTDYLEIDNERNLLTKSLSGTRSVDMTIPMSGDWITLDPQDGDPIIASYPSLEVSAGTAEVLYRKAYL